jgi:hypothetical protein
MLGNIFLRQIMTDNNSQTPTNSLPCNRDRGSDPVLSTGLGLTTRRDRAIAMARATGLNLPVIQRTPQHNLMINERRFHAVTHLFEQFTHIPCPPGPHYILGLYSSFFSENLSEVRIREEPITSILTIIMDDDCNLNLNEVHTPYWYLTSQEQTMVCLLEASALAIIENCRLDLIMEFRILNHSGYYQPFGLGSSCPIARAESLYNEARATRTWWSNQ